jgi:hypothetical protein
MSYLDYMSAEALMGIILSQQFRKEEKDATDSNLR